MEEILSVIKKNQHKEIEFKKLKVDFFFWPVAEIEKNNTEYQIKEFLPGYYGIGSSGGGEMLTIELSTGILYAVPFIPMDESERIKIADSITAFVTSVK